MGNGKRHKNAKLRRRHRKWVNAKSGVLHTAKHEADEHDFVSLDLLAHRGNNLLPLNGNVQEVILGKKNKDKNTCLFYAMLNSLQTMEERIAFANCPLSPSGNEDSYFRTIISTIGITQSTDVVRKYGYVARDIEIYLAHLKDQGIISAWTFKTIPKFSFAYLNNSSTSVPWTRIILFGSSTTQTFRKVYVKSILNVVRAGLDMSNPTPILTGTLNETSLNYKGDCYRHGVSLTRDGNGEYFYFDNGNNIRKWIDVKDSTSLTQLCTIANITTAKMFDIKLS
jgi:hypothetical protein